MKYVFKVKYVDFKNNERSAYITIEAGNIRRAWHCAVTYANNMTFNPDIDRIDSIEYRGETVE